MSLPAFISPVFSSSPVLSVDAEDTSAALDDETSPEAELSSPEAEDSPPAAAEFSSPEVEDPSPWSAELSSPEEADSVPDSEDSSPEEADCPSDSLEVTSPAELEGSSSLAEYLSGSNPGINGSRPSSSAIPASSAPPEGDTELEHAKSPNARTAVAAGSKNFIGRIRPPVLSVSLTYIFFTKRQ